VTGTFAFSEHRPLPPQRHCNDRSGMSVVSAESVDGRLADSVPAEGCVALLHSCFDNVVNVVLVDGRLCCLSSTMFEDAPRTIRIDRGTWPRLAWRRDQQIRISRDHQHRGASGEITISFEHAERWQPTIADLSGIEAAHLDMALSVIDRNLPLRSTGSSFEIALADQVQQRVSLLEHALCHGDVVTVTKDASGLIGLGTGLTPTGDDVLVGLAVVAGADGTLLRAFLPALRLALGGDRPLRSRTTAVSAAVLEEAVQGRGHQRLHELLAAIAGPVIPRLREEHPMTQAIDRVLAIGHRSGGDLLTGMRLGLKVERHLRLRARAPRRPGPQRCHRRGDR
jgi:hypothetical protein